MKRSHILVVDDEPHMIWLLRETFGEDFEVLGARNQTEAMTVMAEHQVDLVLLDLRLQKEDGLAVLKEIKQFSPAVPVIVITAYASVPTAVEAMKRGAYDYITKPFDLEELRNLIRRALNIPLYFVADQSSRHDISEEMSRNRITARSEEMLGVWNLVKKVAPTEAGVLITGESGTGKELIAKAIHAESQRRHMPFVAINCAALPETLLESEFFGYEEGAFTGARNRKAGKFELAHGGTLLLDEIGDMPMSTQVKILRTLEEQVVERLGGTRRIPVDVRIIASTNKDLLELVKKNMFREDLYFRLAVFPIHVPPLRERTEDIPVLARHFLKLFAAKYRKEGLKDFHPAVLDIFSRYPWPGNVRELRNLVQQLVILSEGPVIQNLDLPSTFRAFQPHPPAKGTAGDESLTPQVETGPSYVRSSVPDLERSRNEAERRVICDALRYCDGNRTRAARLLGISRRTFQLKLKKLNIE
ncbi:MAG: sigma-54 dependent transcriptional regulator [Peptococcaceae bacterium]|nr:sigma-54 dependent transcriptional regulator [Peptococcaceae bacterium]